MSSEQLYRQAKPLCATQREERSRDRKGAFDYFCGTYNNSEKARSSLLIIVP